MASDTGLFTAGHVSHLRLQVASNHLASLESNPRTYVPALLQEGTQSWTQVALKLKGGPGSFRPISKKPSFTLNMDKWIEGHTYHGLDKFHLNNAVHKLQARTRHW